MHGRGLLIDVDLVTDRETKEPTIDLAEEVFCRIRPFEAPLRVAPQDDVVDHMSVVITLELSSTSS